MKLEYRGKSTTFAGFYDEDSDTIYLAEGLSPLEMECTFFHERQHRRCFQSKCKCWGRKTNYLAEYHAFKGELEAVVLSGSKRLALVYLKAIGRTLKKFDQNPKVWKDHEKALARVMQSEMFLKLKRETKQWKSL